MAYFAAFYTYAGSPAELDAIRPAHREFLGSLEAIVASGPLLETSPGRALLLLRGDSVAEIERLLDDDPFRAANLIAQREVLPWNPVIGVFAE